ncbi:ankyrin repeat-containing protein [Plakobranchus ocellatus]|uniref:Ankyrin repeat-containing protein n=1 Tax=Plakobranchus ocellatus TaxID=259542 RepID=A0AAV4A611_9GAST|nr:ankyrin repeat-containing protein [Plakobranchus ocellatus]
MVDSNTMYTNKYLLQAIRRGCVDMVEEFLSKRICSPNCWAVDSLGTPALVLCINGYKLPPHWDRFTMDTERCTLVRILVLHGAQLEACDKDSMTAVLYAAERGFLRCLQFLAEAGANLLAADKDGRNALVYSAMKGHHDCLQYLVERIPARYVNQQTKRGQTALMLSAKYKETTCLQILLSAGAEVNTKDSEGYTAIMYSLTHGDDQASTSLLNSGAHINIVARDGKTPFTLAMASSYEDYSWILRLLELGADLTLSKRDQYSLLEMIVQGQKVILQKMIMNGCMPFYRKCGWLALFDDKPDKALSPLAVALLCKQPDIANYFLANCFLTRYDVVHLCYDPDIHQNLDTRSNNNNEELRREKSLEILNFLSRRPQKLFNLSLIAVLTTLNQACSQTPPQNKNLPPQIHPHSLGARLRLLWSNRQNVRPLESASTSNCIQTRGLTRRQRVERLNMPVPLKRALLFQTPLAATDPFSWADIPMGE